MSFVGGVIKSVLHACGLDVRLTRNVARAQRLAWDDAWRANARSLTTHEIRTVIDIGANTGQFAKLIHPLFPEARIYSFEPLPDCLAELQRTLADIPGAVALPLALGDVTGTVEFNRSAFSPSSSFLEMTDVHRANWPASSEQHKTIVSVRRLDDVMADANLSDGILVKMDVQGFEDRVIRGGVAVISRSKVVVVEVSFVELYVGQPLFDDIYRLLRELGFAYRGNIEQFTSKTDGQVLFADAIFVNEDLHRERAGTGA